MIKMRKLDSKIFLIGIVFLFLPLFVSADYGGQKTQFFVDSAYDLEGRQEIDATLLRITPRLYFYLDDGWWDSLSEQDKFKAKLSIQELGKEFEDNIYLSLISVFGSEWKPGIDDDDKITVLIHPMISQAGGYFNNGDEYPTARNPRSNKREMIYLNAYHLNTDLAKGFLAHEFVHLITFNQKERRYGVQEKTWLNEARAEYAPTLVGYDSKGGDSNLNRRIRDFLRDPSNSFIDWENEKADYGVLNLFVQYLVDQYGIEILADSLHSSKTGISSLNYALSENGFEQDFDDVFDDWIIAVLVNDCDLGETYCYLNPVLKNFKLIPSINFLPLTGESSLSLSETTNKWSGNWYKFIGGWGTLKVEFVGSPSTNFRVAYVTQDLAGNQSLDFFDLNDYQKGEISVSDFGKNITSLIIIPSVQDKLAENSKTIYPFFWRASTEESEEGSSSGSSQTQDIQEILDKIEVLEKQLVDLRGELQILLGAEASTEGEYVHSCSSINQNLAYGIRNNAVTCLQEFLKAQGEEIYPEGFVTGFFGNLTRQAVVRFQEKYADEILAPLELSAGTGFVGPSTRAKINEMINK